MINLFGFCVWPIKQDREPQNEEKQKMFRGNISFYIFTTIVFLYLIFVTSHDGDRYTIQDQEIINDFLKKYDEYSDVIIGFTRDISFLKGKCPPAGHAKIEVVRIIKGKSCSPGDSIYFPFYSDGQTLDEYIDFIRFLENHSHKSYIIFFHRDDLGTEGESLVYGSDGFVFFPTSGSASSIIMKNVSLFKNKVLK
jgi:hypothetical protein